MRIVHVIDYYQPKLGYQEAFLVREQRKLGHELHVVTSDRYHPRPQYESTWQPILGPRILGPGVCTENGASVHRLGVAFEKGTRIWLKGLARTLLALHPDLVIVHGIGSFTAARVACLAPSLGDCRVVFDSHASEANSRHPLRHLFYFFYRLLLRPLFQRRADAIVAVEDDRKDFLVRRYGFPESEVTMIPAGADPALFRRDEEARREVRVEWKCTDEDVVLIYTGKIERRKAIDLFLEAGLQIGASDARVKVVIVGSGDEQYIEEMKEQVARAGAQSRVVWVPAMPNEQLYRVYSAADVSVWPMMVSIGTLEAMACGLPLVVADVPTLHEQVAYDNGLTCRPGDLEDLKAKLQILVADPPRRRRMGENGRRLVQQELNWSNIAQRFIDVAKPNQGGRGADQDARGANHEQ
jgi:glycosyltransferase involved in cell wall biosynthesis